MSLREEIENSLVEFLDDEEYGTDHYTDKIISLIEKRIDGAFESVVNGVGGDRVVKMYSQMFSKKVKEMLK